MQASAQTSGMRMMLNEHRIQAPLMAVIALHDDALAACYLLHMFLQCWLESGVLRHHGECLSAASGSRPCPRDSACARVQAMARDGMVLPLSQRGSSLSASLHIEEMPQSTHLRLVSGL